jgi:hypothetical protein
MKKQIFRWMMMLFFGGLLVLGQWPALQQYLDQHGLIPAQYAYGDIYNMTNLRAYRETDYPFYATVPATDKPTRRAQNVNFYLIGDSFTDIDTSYYVGSNNNHIWINVNIDTIRPDLGRKQILVIEFIERVVQERLGSPDLYIDRGFKIKDQPHKQVTDNQLHVPWYRWRFGEQINPRLEFLLFNFKPFLWLKEQKAQLLYTAFERTHGGFLVNKRPYYASEADPHHPQSSFIPVSDREIDRVVKSLNIIRTYYRSHGIDEVYVAFIPNKVTVFNYSRLDYNHQIERLEANPNLKVPLLSTIDTLRAHPDWYHLGDGHWNRDGKRYWLRRVNQLIAEWDAGHPPKDHIIH